MLLVNASGPLSLVLIKVSGKRFWPGAEIVYQGCGNFVYKKIHIRKNISKKITYVRTYVRARANFCPRCARAKICQDDLGLQETIYRPREELHITEQTLNISQ